jgi:ABC-type antimicrobial peptide transport system permease subunit
LVAGVRAALRSTDADMPTTDFQTLGDIVDRSVSPRRFTLMLIEAFAVTALVLASLGIYGVLSYTVSRRTQEMGIRMALGASGAQLKRQVVIRTLVLAGIGIVIGWIGAFSLSRLMDSLLYGVEPNDPSTFIAVTVLLVVIAGVAGYAPARRASKIDPMSVLTS